MTEEVLASLRCPSCPSGALQWRVFSAHGRRIVDGVAWCRACASWYPIEGEVLELLPPPLMYADDRTAFWGRFAGELAGAGLAAPAVATTTAQTAQLKQQRHFDWYGTASQQTYTDYERMPFWQAFDDLVFEQWRPRAAGARRLLEFGCAQGRSTFRLTDLPLDIVAFDVSKVLVRQAVERHRASPGRANVVFFVADATRFPFASDTFDCVLGYGVLHHLTEPAAACREIARVLTHDGRYLGAENNESMFRSAFEWVQRVRPLWTEEAGSQPLMSGGDFRSWFPASDFDVRTFTTVFIPPHLLNHGSRSFARTVLRRSDALFRSVPILRDQGGLIIVEAARYPIAQAV